MSDQADIFRENAMRHDLIYGLSDKESSLFDLMENLNERIEKIEDGKTTHGT